MKGWLVHAGLRFADDAEERRFLQSFALDRRLLIQAVLFAGGVIVYVFFIWDQIVDPQNAKITHLIRGLLILPTIWLTAAALFIRRLDAWFEYIVIFPAFVTAAAFNAIFVILERGYDFAVGGYLLLLFFVFSLIPLRTPFIIAFSLFSWVAFAVAEVVSGNERPGFGMFIVNNLLIGSAVFVGLLAVISREYVLRQQFQTMRELRDSRIAVTQLERSNRILRDTTQHLLDGTAANLLISYRRSDSDAIAGRIRDRLVARFGERAIFMDIDSIPLGFDFREQIKIAARQTKILLAIIGPHWLGPSPDGSARIFDENDPVRVEIEMALNNGIHLIPVLVGNAKMPSAAELPESVKDISFRNALAVDAGRDFHQHVDRLIRSMELVLGDPAATG
jgi:hypothetical protein